jgi:hypothetical protein
LGAAAKRGWLQLPPLQSALADGAKVGFNYSFTHSCNKRFISFSFYVT